MFKEFKEFAMRGNVVDMAVGIVIGAAFGGIVKSFVDDILMPPLGVLMGRTDFSQYKLTLAQEGEKVVSLNYGHFANTIVNFLIVAFAIFLLIKAMNRLKREKPAPPPAPTTKECPFCCSTIPIKATRCAHCTADIKALAG